MAQATHTFYEQYKENYLCGEIPHIDEVGDDDEPIIFDKIGSTIYGGVWEYSLDGLTIRIIAVKDGYRTNLTGTEVMLDFGSAIARSLAEHSKLTLPKFPPTSWMEVYATNERDVYVVHSYKEGKCDAYGNVKHERYEVNTAIESCTCPHYHYRHEQNNFCDKHIEFVKQALLSRLTAIEKE